MGVDEGVFAYAEFFCLKEKNFTQSADAGCNLRDLELRIFLKEFSNFNLKK